MGAEDGMWTEAHRARHEPGLKELVAACAVEEIAAWLERADPPRSGRATPVRRVGGAIAWHLRVGGPWRALPAGWPPWRTVYGWFRRWLALGLFDGPPRGGGGPPRRHAAGRGAPPAAQGRPAAGAGPGHRRHAGGEVHRRPRPARGSLPSGQPQAGPGGRGRGRARARAGGPGRRRGALARGGRRAGLGAGPGRAGGAGRGQGALALPARGRLRRRVRGRALPRVVERPRHAAPRGRPRPGGEGLRGARAAVGGGAELRLAVAP